MRYGLARNEFDVFDQLSHGVSLTRIEHVFSRCVTGSNYFYRIFVIVEHGEGVLTAIDDSNSIAIREALVDNTRCYWLLRFGAKDFPYCVGEGIGFLFLGQSIDGHYKK